MKIKTSNPDYHTLVDADLYEFLNQFNWQLQCGYARRNRKVKDSSPGKSHWVHLHREVLRLRGVEIPQGLVVDHINRNKLDNRFENLRVVTRSINGKNVDDSVKSKRIELAKVATAAAAMVPRNEKQRANGRRACLIMNSTGKNRHVGKDHFRSFPVIDLNTGIVFDNIRIAAEALNINYSTLRSKLNGALKNNTSLMAIRD